MALWTRIIGRTRQIPKKFNKTTVINRVCVYTTPEGFNFAYRLWAKNKTNDEYDYVKASSMSNPYLPRSYIDSLLKTYTTELATAYIHGDFVNLTSGTVYSHYNRAANNSVETIQPKEPLYIGLDFNVTRQAATVFVKRPKDTVTTWHAVAELIDMYDTPETVRIIKERFPEHSITIYPDASGGARKTVNASTSDIAILAQAGFMVKSNKSNPRVKDRVLAANTAFSKGLVFVNADLCPNVAECLEQQAYDANGEPDKRAGQDHQNDATTYLIAHELPVRKPITNIEVGYL